MKLIFQQVEQKYLTLVHICMMHVRSETDTSIGYCQIHLYDSLVCKGDQQSISKSIQLQIEPVKKNNKKRRVIPGIRVLNPAVEMHIYPTFVRQGCRIPRADSTIRKPERRQKEEASLVIRIHLASCSSRKRLWVFLHCSRDRQLLWETLEN